MLKKNLGIVAIALIYLTVLYLSVEGAVALVSGHTPRVSLLFDLLDRVDRKSLVHDPAQYPPLNNYLFHESEIAPIVDELKEKDIYLSNTPYKKLVDEESRFTYRDKDQILWNKKDVRLRSVLLRSRLFEAFDPILVNQVTQGEAWPPATGGFLKRFGFRETTATTDSNGDRITLPVVDRNKVVLIVGDSMSFGVGLNDDETISSILQSKTSAVRFVNASVPGADTRDNLARLRDRLRIYMGQVESVIYFFSESDIERGPTAERMIAELDEILDQNGINTRTLVYGQYIYRTMPDIFRNTPTGELVDLIAYKQQTLKNAREQGFKIVDLYDIVRAYCDREASLMAGLALYVDHSHFSKLGTQMIAQEVASLAGSP